MGDLRGARVLLVDDEPHVTRGLLVALRNSGHELHAAHSGPEALSLLERQRFDVLVADEMMCPMSGAELCEHVATKYPSTARIILTGNPTLTSALAAINQGRVLRILLKPCSSQEVGAAIWEALESSPRVSQRPSMALRHLSPDELEALTMREREVLEQFFEGKRTGQLAEELCISRHTLRNHLKTIFGKLGVHSQVELLNKLQGRDI